ncbi:uncharacterized protein LOC117639012 [Thrips palmi]|uniref:Uncharacterized protein LOC117639012 n=1 Tax=Thrips palmi TaxID=161013 RepID=A0A6P8Y2F4_THRPL|nr:uncharacterized protein LOC117639012 [Thrips palmi]
MAGGTVYSAYSRGVLLCAQLIILLLLTEIQARRCLQYSWLGSLSVETLEGTEVPGRGTDSYILSNLTCKEFPKPKPIPCVTPYLMTYDATTPDPSNVWYEFSSNNRHYIECDPGDGNVCTLVTFRFGNEVVNQTAYCTRVTDDGTNMKKGCATAKKGAYTNTVCVCDPSETGTQFCIPGSGAQSIAAHKMHILSICTTTILLKMLQGTLK